MRIVFMGTPEFAVPSLEALAATRDVVAVYTRPDAASGRGRGLRPSPVKQAALRLGLVVRQPRTLRDPAAQSELAGLAPDLIVVAAYGLILPPEVLEIPPLGCVNVHASLLPRWRGAAPVQRAVLAGDEVTGVSIMRMEQGLDTGPYCEVATTRVAEKTAVELTDELALLGAQTLLAAIPRIEESACTWVEQDERGATYADKITKDDVILSPDLERAAALRRVRASTPQAPARVAIDGRGATILSARLADEVLPAGAVSCGRHELLIGFADGALVAEQVKPDGRGAMKGCDWARGARLDSDARWEAGR